MYFYFILFNYKRLLFNFDLSNFSLLLDQQIKNKIFLYKVLRFRYSKKYLRFNRYSAAFIFRNNNYFRLSQKSFFRKKMLKITYNKATFLLDYKKLFNQNFYPLVGSKISYLNVTLKKNKKWLARRYNFIVKRNYKILKKPKTFFTDNLTFLLKLKLKYKNLKFLFKLIKKANPLHASKPKFNNPYLFLHSSRPQTLKVRNPLKFLVQKFRRHKKLFKLFKKQGYWVKKKSFVQFLQGSHTLKKQKITPYTRNFYLQHKSLSFKNLSKNIYFFTPFFYRKKNSNFLIKTNKTSISAFNFANNLLFYRKKSLNFKLVKKPVFRLASIFIKLNKLSLAKQPLFRILLRRSKSRRPYYMISQIYRSYRVATRLSIFYYIANFFEFKNTKVLPYVEFQNYVQKFFFTKTTKLNSFFPQISIYKNLFKKNKPFLYNYLSIKKTNKLLFIFPYHQSRFVLNLTGFLLVSNPFSSIFKNTSFKRIQQTRNTLYSFTLKKDLIKKALRKYSKRRISLDMQLFFRKKRTFYPKSTNKVISSTYNQFDSTLNNNSLTTTSFLSNYMRNYFSEAPLSVRNFRIKLKKYKKNTKKIHIKRIRFKPGYMRIWRRARESLLVALNLKFFYQHRLTKFLFLFNKVKSISFLPLFEMKITNLLIRSRFVLDLTFAKTYVRSSCVFVNGVLCLNTDFQIFSGDFVQLILSLKYYITFRWLLNNTLKTKKRIKYLSWKSKQRKKKKSIDKQINNNLPLSVLYYRYTNFDIPKFLELDFLTLSFFVLYDPIFFSDLNHLHRSEMKTTILNMYNWKYIT